MMATLFNSLFGCSHRRTTFPITPARRGGFSNSIKGTYVVCLDCGKEFGYNWQEMKVGQPVQAMAATGRADEVAIAHR
jgi:predicted transcriptional regulator